MRVAALTDNGVVQFQYVRTYTRELLRPEDVRKILVDSRAKVGGKYTEWLPSDAQLTVPSSPTNLLEQSSLVSSTVSGVTHTHTFEG